MKKIIAAIFVIAFSANLGFAQENFDKPNSSPRVKTTDGFQGNKEFSSVKTIFSCDSIKNSGYGAFTPKIGQFDGSSRLLLGARGAWLINNSFSLGLAGYGMVPGIDKTYKDVYNNNVNGSVYMGYGGLLIGYMLNPNEIVHYGFNIVLGAGGLSAQNKDSSTTTHWNRNDNQYEESHDPWKSFWVIEPEGIVEANITSFFKIGLSASYRFTAKIDQSNIFQANKSLTDIKLNGFSCGIHFVFGDFD